MFNAAYRDHRVVNAARKILIVSGIAFILFLVGFGAALAGFADSILPAEFYLGAAVVATGVTIILSAWLLSLVSDPAHARRGRELQEAAVQACPDSILQLDEALRVVALNPAAERRFGRSLAAANGMPIAFLLPDPAPSKPATAKPAKPLTFAEDTQPSARRLAGRVGTRLSHLVQPLLGYTELALGSLEPDHPVRVDLAEIGRASSRVVLLARALEMYGGAARSAQVQQVELNSFVDGLELDLRFVLQSGTALRLEKAGEPVMATLDPGLTRLAAMLVTCNAEEAMGPGSTVTISVTDEGSLQIADTGRGLPKDVRFAMFRPLTSTKDAERGVGLGLHAARAAMRLQHGDLILTQSGGRGSLITLTHARVTEPPPTRPRAESTLSLTTTR